MCCYVRTKTKHLLLKHREERSGVEYIFDVFQRVFDLCWHVAHKTHRAKYCHIRDLSSFFRELNVKITELISSVLGLRLSCVLEVSVKHYLSRRGSFCFDCDNIVSLVTRSSRSSAAYFWRQLAWECFADHQSRLSTTVVRDIDSEPRRLVYTGPNRRQQWRPHAKRTICFGIPYTYSNVVSIFCRFYHQPNSKERQPGEH